MAEEKFGGLSPQQLKQLEDLKKTLPDHSEGKSEKKPEEFKPANKTEHRKVKKLIEKIEKEGNLETADENALLEIALKDIVNKAEETGEELILENIATQFNKTPEEIEKIMEKLGYVKDAEEKETSERREKQISGQKTSPTEKKEPSKPEYSKKYLLSVIEKSRIEGDQKLEAYYKAELEKLEEYKKSDKKQLTQKSEPVSREPVRSSKIMSEKMPMPEIKKEPAEKAPEEKAGKKGEGPEKPIEKPKSYEELMGIKKAPEKTAEKPVGKEAEKSEKKKEAAEKTEEKIKEKPQPEKVAEVKEKTPEEIKEERRTGIVKELEKEWETKNGPMDKPLSKREIEKNKEMARLWGKEWDGRTTQITEAASEFFFDHKGKGKSSVPGRAEKILTERYPEYAEKIKEKPAKKIKEKTEVEKETKKAEKQVGKEGLFDKEETPEEIPLGVEAAVRPMGGEKKKPLVERTEEEKKERAGEFKKYQEMKKARAEYADKAKDYYKYQTILGKFKKVFGGKEEAAKVTEEFEAAQKKYEQAQAGFNGEKLIRHNVEERRRVNEIIGARAKENSTFEKIRAGYKWLGDQNLEKVFKPETKTGKIICRAASLRTAVGLGLGLSGFGLALSGGTAAAVGSALFLRKIYSGAASGMGAYEGLRMLAEKKTAILDEEIKNLDLKSVGDKMATIESWAILNGKKITEYPDYVKMRDRRIELLTGGKSVKLSEVMSGQFAKMNEEMDKRNRGEMYRKAAALGMGVFVGSGAMAWTFKKALHGLGIIGETPAPAGARPEIIPKGADIIKESYIETAGGKVNSVWKMTEHQLQSHFGERFNGLNAAQKTYLIDYYKDIVAKNPKAFGLADIDVVKPGQKINFSALFTDQTNFEKGIGKALKLNFAETQNILSNNKILREWVLSHPGERLTSARVEELLKMPKGTMAEHFANDNMVVKPSGVTVTEVIAEQEKIRTAEIVQGMEERAVARILNNTIQESGLTWEEYRAIKGVSVKQLLEQAHWDNWKAGTVDLPHDGVYGGVEFARQVKLAEAIRSLNPSGGQLDMSVEDYLKGAIKEGKFSSRGAIESAAGPAVPEGSPAEIEARPRGVPPGEDEARPKGAAVLAEKQPAKIGAAEAAAETKAAPKFERMTNFVYDDDGKITGMALNITPEDTVRANGLMNDNWRETVLNQPELKNKSLAMSAISNRARAITAYQRTLEGLQSAGKGNSPEAEYLKKFINRTIENTEKQYGDVFK